MYCVRLGLVLSICLIGVSAPATAAQPDVERIDELYDLIDREVSSRPLDSPPPNEVVDAFYEWLNDLSIVSAEQLGLARELGIPSRRFAAALNTYAAEHVSKAWRAGSRRERFDQLTALLRDLGNPAAIDGSIARYVGVRPPGAYLEQAYGPIAEPESPPRVARQLSITSEADELAIRVADSAILTEVGGAGAGNRVLDAGEWVRLRLLVENPGSRPYFSSSAWVVPGSECVWTDRLTEHRLAEMAPDGGEAQLMFWVYLATDCDDDYEIDVRVKDTHRAPGRPQAARLRMRPVPRVAVDLTHTFFDTDVPGFSDGSGAIQLEPDLRFELGTDLRIRQGDVRAARVKYGVVEPLTSLFTKLEHRDVDQIQLSYSQFEAGDDLDAEVAAQDSFENELRKYGYSKQPWYEADEGGVLWVAVDVQLDVVSPDPQEPEEERRRRAEEPVLTFQHIDYIGALVKKHIMLVTRPAEPEVRGALDATDGYEVVFDDDGFMNELAVLLKPTEDSAAKPPLRPDTLPYRFRRYIPVGLPAIASPPPPPPPPPPEPTYEPEPEPEPDPEPFIEQPAMRRALVAEFGGGLSLVSVHRAFTSGSGTAVPMPAFQGRLTGGVGVFRWGFEVAYQNINGELWELKQTDVLTGPSLSLRMGDVAQFEPRAYIGGQARALPSLTLGSTTTESDHKRNALAFELGTAFRFRIADPVGFLFDASYVFSEVGPWGWQREYQYKPGSFRVVLGLSIGKHAWYAAGTEPN